MRKRRENETPEQRELRLSRDRREKENQKLTNNVKYVWPKIVKVSDVKDPS